MSSAKKKESISKKDIVSKFMNYVLEKERFPSSAYKFCQDNGINETEFYQHFGSVETMKSAIWEMLFENACEVMEGNEIYPTFSNRDKMLTFFFTFFELCSMNRSYIIFALNDKKPSIKNIESLKGIRVLVKRFASELITSGNENKTHKFTKNPVALFSEGAWIQFLFLLKFWLDDDSPGFEKTDMAIEKSVNTIFDVFDNTPISSVLDFGKFIIKEKWRWN